MLADSYEPSTPVPKVGSRWVWEIDLEAVRTLIEVTEVRWNGEEWWVRSSELLPPRDSHRGSEIVWADLGRFMEAVTPVGGTIGSLLENRPALVVEGG